MTLFLLNNTGQSYGQFDAYDTELTSFKGGEVCSIVGVTPGANDLEAKDVADGYDNTTTKQRPVVTKVLGATTAPLFLADDGTGSTSALNAGYGTLFGVLIGGTAGQISGSNGTVLGPHTAAGSGKITLWSNNGLYGVSLDAMQSGSGGVDPINSNLTVGKPLTYTATGLLTPVGGTSAAGSVVVAYFLEFSTGDTLVTTPNSLTRLGTGSGALKFKYAVIDWRGSSV